MLDITVNWLAVLIAAISGMALGAIWYSPKVFGTVWMTMIGKKESDMQQAVQKGMGKLYGAAFLGTLIMSYVLAHFVTYTGALTVFQGMQTGFWLWLGFIATTTLGDVLWVGHSVKLYILNNSYNLLSLMIMGAILAVWR